MEKECLIAEIKAYAEHIRTANDCLTVFKSICDAAKKYNEEVNLSPAFFQISRNATLYTYCMEVVKLFDNAGNTRSIQKLLNVAKANQNLFPRKIETC